jgi:hypothetical protein
VGTSSPGSLGALEVLGQSRQFVGGPAVSSCPSFPVFADCGAGCSRVFRERVRVLVKEILLSVARRVGNHVKSIVEN